MRAPEPRQETPGAPTLRRDALQVYRSCALPALWGRLPAALVGYVCVAAAFAWPLPIQLSSALPGPPGSDTGVYVWNLWVFRHEILNGHFPFFTDGILSMAAPSPLILHNYTTFANVLAYPLLPLIGTVATYNLLLIAFTALTAFAMFLFARATVRDGGAAWVAGLVFGFSPFISARAMEHFSLVQAAPLPLFALLLARLQSSPSTRTAVATGAVVAWAFLCDPYYAVYCVLMAAFAIAYAVVTVQPHARPEVRVGWRALLDVLLLCLAGLIVGIVVSGGGQFELFGLRVSVVRLYTPVLAFTVLASLRAWIAIRPRVSLALPPLGRSVRVLAVASVACVILLSPVLSAMVPQLGARHWLSPKVLWRSSAAGMDLLAFFVPNPLHPLWGDLFRRGLEQMPGGLVENVASIPWVVLAVLLLAIGLRSRLPRYWLLFTAFFGLLALGPFVEIAGVHTYVPTPWSLLRYVPIVGAARMPTRFAIMVMFGIVMLLAFALRDLRGRWKRPARATAVVTVLLLAELSPAPRYLHSARIPSVYHIIAADPRPVRILQLPFGLRDGTTSYGNFSADYQYFQTLHRKQLLGGYLSRLPAGRIEHYRQLRLLRVLLDMSTGMEIPDVRFERALLTAKQTLRELNVSYVVINRERAQPQLEEFARRGFGMKEVAVDGPHVLLKAVDEANQQ